MATLLKGILLDLSKRMLTQSKVTPCACQGARQHYLGTYLGGLPGRMAGLKGQAKAFKNKVVSGDYTWAEVVDFSKYMGSVGLLFVAGNCIGRGRILPMWDIEGFAPPEKLDHGDHGDGHHGH